MLTKSEPSQLTANQRFRYIDFVAVISSQSEGLGKMALGIVKIYLGSFFSANRRCSRSVVVDPTKSTILSMIPRNEPRTGRKLLAVICH